MQGLSHQDSIADAFAVPPGPGAEAIRRALRGPAGRVALRLPTPAGPGQRRVAIAMLEEAGRGRGGAVLETAAGDLLLTESEAAEAERVAAILAGLLGTHPDRYDMPTEAAALLALPAPAPAAAQLVPPPAAGIEAACDAAPLEALLRREGVLHLSPGVPRRLALLRLAPDRAALAARLGPAAADPDLLRHAEARLAARLLRAVAEPALRDALLGGPPAVPLLLDLPLALLPDPVLAGGDDAPAAPVLYASLTAAEALAERVAARAAALRGAGWGIAVRGLDAAALALLAPEALPAELLLLRWSPALAERPAMAALRRIDPARLILTRCDVEAALEWGLSLGVSRFAGPWIAALMAATRMAACAHAAACRRTECIARAAAAAPAGRAGCLSPALLAAFSPIAAP